MVDPTRFGQAWFRLLNLLLVLAFACAGQPAASHAAEQHCLWKVQGTNATVYLLGSMQYLRKDQMPPAEPIEKAFEKAQIVAFETDLEAMGDRKTQAHIGANARLPDGQTLAKKLPKEMYARLREQLRLFASADVATSFEHYRPWFASTVLLALELPSLGVNPYHTLDHHYFGRAQEAGKTILPLSNTEDHYNVLIGLTEEDEQAYLRLTLKEVENLPQHCDNIVAAWLKGDVAKLDQYLNEPVSKHPRLYQRLVIDRARNWVGQIEKLLRDRDAAMVIVGTENLIGQNGVVALLQKKGYKVIQE